MKKYLIAAVAVFTVLAVAMPSFALEVKYGGLFRLRMQSQENVQDGQDGKYVNPAVTGAARTPFGSLDDNGNWIDQRLRMYFTFVGSENLQVVTKWEADTIWGNETQVGAPPVGGAQQTAGSKGGGGDVGSDAVNLEMKNAYIDFAIPMTTARAMMGVQGISLLRGWILDDDFSAAVFSSKMDPFKVQVGYIAAHNEDVNTSDDNVDDYYMTVEYADGPFKAALFGLFQDGNEFDVANNSSIFTVDTIDPGLIGVGTQQGTGPAFNGGFGTAVGGVGPNNAAIGATNNMLDFMDEVFGFSADSNLADQQKFFDLGLSLEYKLSYLSAYVNFVKNFGGWDRGENISGLVDGAGRSLNLDEDFNGWMVDAGASYFCGPWTFTLSGFVTSGGDITKPGDFGDFFRYPAGGGHYWSEILGNGTLHSSVGEARDGDRQKFNMGYSSGAQPSNIWTIQAGAAYQLLKGTKLTLNYWYIGTVEDVVSDATRFFTVFNNNGTAAMSDFSTSDSIGHELDFYLDQQVVDGLNLRLVGAYLFAEGAYTALPHDDDAYELGAQLLWSF